MNKFQIIIISLRRHSSLSANRTKLLVDRIKSFGINVDKIIFLGVYGEKLKNKKINTKYISERFASRQILGTLGCSLSHACALNLIQSKNINSDVFIFEEDADLNENIFDFFYNCKSAPNGIPKNYDIAFLHAYFPYIFYNQEPNLDDKTLFDNASEGRKWFPKELPPSSKNLGIFKKIINPVDYRTPSGSQCYVVNANNIKNIIKHSFPFSEAIDWCLWKPNPNLNKYVINPSFKLLLHNPKSISIRQILDAGRNFHNT